MPALNRALARPLRTFVWLGVSLGVLLAAGLVAMLLNDCQRRQEAAQRQSSALATGAQRLLRLELRTLERVLQGISRDGALLFQRVPEQAPDLLDASIAGALQRHAELHSIVVVDPYGRALTSGSGDLQLPLWAVDDNRGQDSQVFLGPPQALDATQWILPLALPMGGDRWLLARLRTAELQSIIGGMDTGDAGVISITDPHGYILARSPDPAGVVGHRFGLAKRELLRRDALTPLGTETSAVDGIERISSLSTLAQYPLAVYAGLGRRDVLAAWWPYVQASVGVYLLYWLLFAAVYVSLRRATRDQDSLSEELRTGHTELRMAHQVGKVCTWYVDEDACLLRWSPLAREIFGIDIESLPVADFFARVHRDDTARMQQAFDAAFAGSGVLD